MLLSQTQNTTCRKNEEEFRTPAGTLQKGKPQKRIFTKTWKMSRPSSSRPTTSRPASASHTLLPSLKGFVFTEKLGSGTYATVYKAYRKVNTAFCLSTMLFWSHEFESSINSSARKLFWRFIISILSYRTCKFLL